MLVRRVQRSGGGTSCWLALALSHYALLIVAWVGAWLLHERLAVGSASSLVDTAYWTTAKLLVWLLPIVVAIRARADEPVTAFLSVRDVRRGVVVGIVCGVAFAAVSFAKDAFSRAFAVPLPDPGLVNALLIAPLFEELLFRGFLLELVQRAALPFWAANLLVAAMFLGLHLPGWYVMGSPNLVQGTATIGIVAVGLAAGVAKQRSGSVWGSVVCHFVNNLYSSFLR
jgi:uncharacterized protein